MRMWICENVKCGWVGRKPATLGAVGLTVKVCQNCLKSCIHQEERKKDLPKAIDSDRIRLTLVEAETCDYNATFAC